ncbi:30S ribosomal protein S4 [Candidatus Woesearchaeota archaeon]|nr:30S ribosomal protein S4 [Candidatus Woesearchaeota archaeon]
MGDPRKHRKKYSGPVHPWEQARIETEKKLLYDYGLRNKKEIWRVNSLLKKFKEHSKRIIRSQSKQIDIEREQLLHRLKRYGLLQKEQNLDDILGLSTEAIMNRRLDALLVKKGLARSPKQARQLIVHHHVTIGDKKITTPSFLVSLDEEKTIQFSQKSSLSNDNHPERIIEKQKIKKETIEQKDAKTITDPEEDAPSIDEVFDKEVIIDAQETITNSEKEVVTQDEKAELEKAAQKAEEETK